MKVVVSELVLLWSYLKLKPSSPLSMNSVAFPSSQRLTLLSAPIAASKATQKWRVTVVSVRPPINLQLLLLDDRQPPLLLLPTEVLPLFPAIVSNYDLPTNAILTLHEISPKSSAVNAVNSDITPTLVPNGHVFVVLMLHKHVLLAWKLLQMFPKV